MRSYSHLFLVIFGFVLVLVCFWFLFGFGFWFLFVFGFWFLLVTVDSYTWKIDGEWRSE